MAIEIPIENVADMTPAKMTRRTWRVQLEAPANLPSSAWWVKAHREEATYNQAGALLRTEPDQSEMKGDYKVAETKPRTAAQIAKQEFTAAGVTLTGAQLMAVIAAAIDIFDQEDAEAAKADKIKSDLAAAANAQADVDVQSP